jgi:hypothetical protein
MYSSLRKKQDTVNYLSLRAMELNSEDSYQMTVLIHQLFNEYYTMASRLINRGANADYVNSNG